MSDETQTKAGRRKFIALVGGGTIVAALGATGLSLSDDMPAEAIAAWNGADVNYGDDVRRWILSYAILAPNPHNLQAWRIDLSTPDEITLYCDASRLLPESDPFNRQVLIGHGAFLELLVIAAAEAGYAAAVSLFPEGVPGDTVDARPVARVRLAKGATTPKDALFAQITRRSTNRNPFDAARSPTDTELRELLRFPAPQEIIRESTTEPGRVALLGDIAARSWDVEQNTPRTWNESIVHMYIGAAEIARHREGISLYGPSIWWGRLLGLVNREQLATPNSRAFNISRTNTNNLARAATAWVWIKSRGNTRNAQIAAGRAYLRLCLRATSAGFILHPYSQALQEFPEMSARFNEMRTATACNADETLQMFARIGRATPQPHSPRRPLDSFVL